MNKKQDAKPNEWTISGKDIVTQFRSTFIVIPVFAFFIHVVYLVLIRLLMELFL